MYQTIASFTPVGKLSSTHGLEGGIILVHHLKGKNSLKQLSFVFIELKAQSYIPFKIATCRILSESDAIVQFEGVTTVEAAKTLTGKQVYLPEEQYSRLQPEDLTLNFKGYILYDQNDQKVGVVSEVTEYPGQLMASVILANQKEALIPVVEQHIINIDPRQKTLTLHIPDGLIDIYL